MLESRSMKKVLGIVVLCLLLSGNAYSEVIELNNCKYKGEGSVDFTTNILIDKENRTAELTTSSGQSKKMSITHNTNSNSYSTPLAEFKDFTQKSKYDFYPDKSQYVWSYYVKKLFNDEFKLKNQSPWQCEKIESIAAKQKKQDAIMFTIKDKREQCEAIGFKPKTEKFADCVLRLVELDINKQQDNKIAAAQNSGNMQIANQLLQMRNDNNAQYLIDLGQQLLTPQSFNSNIYLPQTQNCTIMGFDSFAKMTCN